MTDVRQNCRRILDQIHKAAVRCSRDPASIKLIAVTKTVPPHRISQVVECGIRDVGENRLQEALPKIAALSELPLTWHFIGHLQTNKAKKIVEHFQWVQCVDRSELAEKLNQATPNRLPVLIEVKLDEEPNKSGIQESGLRSFVEDFGRYDK